MTDPENIETPSDPTSWQGRLTPDASKAVRVHDEVEIPFGEVRLKEGGGLGGHNGLRSMEQSLHSREFWRVRVGVGRPDNTRISLADYVLHDFSEPLDEVLALIGRAADTVEQYLCRD